MPRENIGCRTMSKPGRPQYQRGRIGFRPHTPWRWVVLSTGPLAITRPEQSTADDDYLKAADKKPREFLFNGPCKYDRCITTRHYARLVSKRRSAITSSRLQEGASWWRVGRTGRGSLDPCPSRYNCGSSGRRLSHINAPQPHFTPGTTPF